MTDTHWHPVMRAADLRRAPKRVLLDGEALVLFRSNGAIACLRDMCPHRAASLSRGTVVDGDIACPYHGWRFNGRGECTHVPLLDGAPPRRFVRRFDTRESHGLIFITRDAEAAGPITAPVWDGQPKVERILESRATTTLADAVENVLDPIHTLFVHRGLIRGASGPTSRVTLNAAIEDGGLVLRYRGEEKSSGLLSRLLEGRRSHAISRFDMPGIVSLQYWGPEHLNLVTTLYFTREAELSYRGFAVMTGPRQRGFGVLKAMAFVPIMRKVIAQDLAVMKDATENWVAAGRPPNAESPLDILRPFIEAVIAGDPAMAQMAPREITLDL
jgi:nitrite reductase/ring-hydroxylating ferredoxin subunit